MDPLVFISPFYFDLLKVNHEVWMTLGLVFSFMLKHFICDFVIVNERMCNNKRNYFSVGAAAHSIIHGIGTFIVLSLFFPISLTVVLAPFIDMFLHHHIDYIKELIEEKIKIPFVVERVLTIGIDQLLHMMTYLFIISLLFLSGFLTNNTSSFM